tara:strand:+ start:192 stop:539 length:348 start_codon:yes stop_codon:yes gene_type:complete
MLKPGLSKDSTRLVMLEDVISTDGKLVENLLDLSGGNSKHVCKQKPSSCPKCESPEVLGVEIIGAYDGILFWECDVCEHTILRFKEEITEKYLQLAKGLWTNPEDWGYVPRSKFN